MITYGKVTDIFCIADEFCKNFEKTTKNFILGRPSRRPPTMSDSEIISILLLFQISGFKCFKHYYIFYVQKHMQDDFPKTVSYNRFVELSQSVIMSLTIFLKTCCSGSCTGISFVDSTPNQQSRQTEMIVYVGLALLFQPFLKIAFGKQVWNIVDVTVGISLFHSKPNKT